MKSITLLSGAALSICLPLSIHAQKKPNIIFIITDQQRGDALGCAGKYGILTPNLDSLAADGYYFNNAYSAAPSSTPARSGLLTGLSPWHHGLLGYANKIGEHYPFEMPLMIRDHGYLTLGIGKMHWTPQNALHGFHATLIDESGRVESPDFCSDYRKWFQTMAPGQNPDATGLDWNGHGAAAYKLDEDLHPTAWTGATAEQTIRHFDPDGEQPLFLKISFARPHSPYDPPQRILDMYEGIEIPTPAQGEWSKSLGADITDPAQNPTAAFAQFSDDYITNTRRHYYASVTFIDEQVGKIVRALKDKGMYDNTIILFTSDHGDMMGDHHSWRKTYAYEGSAAIPMIMKTPASVSTILPKGSVVEQPVELRDILPTFIDIAGGEVPQQMDGRSMLTLVTEENPEWRRWIDLEHATCYTDHNYWCGLTDGKLKYIWFLRTGEEQLFDLTADPDECVNVVGDKRYASTAEEMRRALAEHLSERGEEWVRDGKLQTRSTTLLYSPNFPKP
ncbi:MAG: arylsulfatase [Paramuribaculum sp.]|nr:arylsulfatase [Paramuribaculum sp.]